MGRNVVAVGLSCWSPFQYSINRCSAGMYLKRVGEHDKNDDCGPTDGRRNRCRVHANNITSNTVSKRKVPGNCNENIDRCGAADAGKNYTRGLKMAIVANFV